jgi:hypothetical protein
MHRPIQYAESTARLFLHLIDSLLMLLSQRELPQPEDSSLQEKYDYITNVRSREMARELVTEICGWYPEHVTAVPTKHDISLRVSARVFAVLTPRISFFNVYTYDRSGNWTRYRIDNKAHVKSVQPILRANVEALLLGDGLTHDDERTLEARYSYIRDPAARALARQLVKEIQSWNPEQILTEPTADSISIKSSGRVFAYIVPRMAYFNVYTYDAAGEWTRYRVDNESNIAAVLPLVQANYEKRLPADDRSQVPVTEEERADDSDADYWQRLMERAPDEYETVHQLIDSYQGREGITIDRKEKSVVMKLYIEDADQLLSLFFLNTSGHLQIWPNTIRGQLGRAGLDRNLVDSYETRLRRILDMPPHRRELGRDIGEVDTDDFKLAVDMFIEEVQRRT